MPNYKHKLMNPLEDADFVKGMTTGRFVNLQHKGLIAFLFYTGARISEALKMEREQFRREGSDL